MPTMPRVRALDAELARLRVAAAKLPEGTDAHARAREIIAALRAEVDAAPALETWRAIAIVRTAREKVEGLAGSPS